MKELWRNDLRAIHNVRGERRRERTGQSCRNTALHDKEGVREVWRNDLRAAAFVEREEEREQDRAVEIPPFMTESA